MGPAVWRHSAARTRAAGLLWGRARTVQFVASVCGRTTSTAGQLYVWVRQVDLHISGAPVASRQVHSFATANPFPLLPAAHSHGCRCPLVTCGCKATI
jgi:hypothetical protein